MQQKTTIRRFLCTTFQALSSKALNSECNRQVFWLVQRYHAFPSDYAARQWQKGSVSLLCELTAAGLFGIYTRFPFNLALSKNRLRLQKYNKSAKQQKEDVFFAFLLIISMFANVSLLIFFLPWMNQFQLIFCLIEDKQSPSIVYKRRIGISGNEFVETLCCFLFVETYFLINHSF